MWVWVQLVKVIPSWSAYWEPLNSNKKAFQSNVDHPLSKSMCFIVNKFEYVQGGCCGGPVQKGEGQGAGLGHRTGKGSGKSLNRQTDTTENITFLQLRWRAIINLTTLQTDRQTDRQTDTKTHKHDWKHYPSAYAGGNNTKLN